MRAALVLLTLCACGAVSYQSRAAPVERSLFARDPSGQLSEADLQRILAAPPSIALPARVGVVPIVTAADWRGPSPDWQTVPRGAGPFAAALRGAEPFTMVTEVLPIPSGALGMEALREVAARYALRYVLLYREGIARRSRANGLAAGYATVVGALFLPGQTLEVDGFVEATLFDVKTGLLLFTARRDVRADRGSNLWYTDQKLDALAADVARRAAPELARDVRANLAGFVAAVQAERTL